MLRAALIVTWFTIQISKEQFSLPRHFDGILSGNGKFTREFPLPPQIFRQIDEIFEFLSQDCNIRLI